MSTRGAAGRVGDRGGSSVGLSSRVGRVASASPAAGQHVVHEQELEALLTDLFDG